MEFMRRHKRISCALIAVFVLCAVSVAVLEVFSRGAAEIFNREMSKQDMLRGTITVEKLIAHTSGRVRFENLEWKDPKGNTILFAPEGGFKVKIWDVLRGHFDAETIEELTLKEAVFSVHFSKDMKVDFVRPSKDFEKMGDLMRDSDDDWMNKISLVGKSEEELRKIMEPDGMVGMIKVKGGYDEDGNPRAINTNDRQIIELDPSWEGGFNTRVAYKNWDLSAVASFRHGGKLISTLYGSSSYLNMLTGRRNNVDVDYWTEDNPTNKYPNPANKTTNDNPKYGTTLGFFSGSYLKFRTITLGYNFKGDWMKKAGISALRAYATVTNPFVLFSPYHDESGMDPETNSRGNENQAAAGYSSKVLVVGFNTPTTRNYLFGLNVTF